MSSISEEARRRGFSCINCKFANYEINYGEKCYYCSNSRAMDFGKGIMNEKNHICDRFENKEVKSEWEDEGYPILAQIAPSKKGEN